MSEMSSISEMSTCKDASQILESHFNVNPSVKFLKFS